MYSAFSVPVFHAFVYLCWVFVFRVLDARSSTRSSAVRKEAVREGARFLIPCGRIILSEQQRLELSSLLSLCARDEQLRQRSNQKLLFSSLKINAQLYRIKRKYYFLDEGLHKTTFAGRPPGLRPFVIIV